MYVSLSTTRKSSPRSILVRTALHHARRSEADVFASVGVDKLVVSTEAIGVVLRANKEADVGEVVLEIEDRAEEDMVGLELVLLYSD